MNADEYKAQEITEYFLGYLDTENKCSKKQKKEFEKEVYFMITTS